MTEGSPKTRDASQLEAYSNLKSPVNRSIVSTKRTRPQTSLGTNRRIVLMNPMHIAQIYGASRNQTDRKTLDISTLPLKRCDTKTSQKHPEKEDWGSQSFDSLLDRKASDEDVHTLYRTYMKPTLVEKSPIP